MPEAAFSNRQMSTLPQLRPIIDLVSIQDALPQRVRVYGIRDRRDLDLVLSVCVCVCISLRFEHHVGKTTKRKLPILAIYGSLSN